MAKATREQARQRRHARVRRKVAGTAERPRLNVYRSNQHIYAQVIDDVTGRHAGVGVDAGQGSARRAGGSVLRRPGEGRSVARWRSAPPRRVSRRSYLTAAGIRIMVA